MRTALSLCLLALLVAAAAAKPDPPAPGPGPTPGPGCSMIKDPKECKHSKDDCVWCESSFSPGSCYSEMQAKFLPPQFFKCKPKPSLEAAFEAAVAALNGKHSGKGKGGDSPAPAGPASCRDEKERKACIKSKAVCSWCEGKFAPAMCMEEAQAKWLPSMAYDCEKSRRAPDDDDKKPYVVAADVTVTKKGGKADPPSCTDSKDSKACRKSDAVCSWCESQFGPAMCVEEDKAKFLPPAMFKCKGSKVEPEALALGRKGGEQPQQDDDEDDDEDGEQPEQPEQDNAASGGHDEADTADDDNSKKHDKKDDDDKPSVDCRDEKERKACIKNRAVCSWCEGKFSPAMCMDEAQAKFIPAMVYDCEKSRRGPDADADAGKRNKKHHDKKHHDRKHKKDDDDKRKKKDADCRDLKERKDCVKARAVCNWCEGMFVPGMCLGESQAKFLPPFVFSCEASRRSADAKAAKALAAPEPGPADPCTDLKEKKCGKTDGCAWCEGTFTADQCFSEAKAKWLPSSMFKCDLPSVATS